MECSLLARVARISLRPTVRIFFEDLFSNPVYLSAKHVYLAGELRFTRDPFDALICAAAQTLALPLITCDAAIRRSGAVEVLW